MSEPTDICPRFGWVLMLIFVGTILVSAYGAYNHDRKVDNLTRVVAEIYYDYCSTRGGTIEVLDAEATGETIDPRKETVYYGCATDADAGVLVIHNGTVIYYGPEDGK